MNINLCYPLFILSFLISCSSNLEDQAKGVLTINYKLNQVEGLDPSYQTVIWIEDLDGKNIKSFLVSEYLSYGGYNDSTICSNWSISTNWDSVSDEIFDAVTMATPSVGQNQLKIELKNEKLLAGKYRYFIETHIIEQYNILYIGEIEIGNDRNGNIAAPVFVPDKHPFAFNALENVTAEYNP